jgi:hypothetical protein
LEEVEEVEEIEEAKERGFVVQRFGEIDVEVLRLPLFG